MVRAVRARDSDTCQLRYKGCTFNYEQIDHIRNIASRNMTRREARDAYGVDDLQCVCKSCHKIKTMREARVGQPFRRESERHPGLR